MRLVLSNTPLNSRTKHVDLTRAASASRTTYRTEILHAAVEYKETWAVAFASYDRAGVDRPEPVPHPDHVNINYETGDVTITGPVMIATLATPDRRARRPTRIAIQSSCQFVP